jgi:hypothetical protein
MCCCFYFCLFYYWFFPDDEDEDVSINHRACAVEQREPLVIEVDYS